MQVALFPVQLCFQHPLHVLGAEVQGNAVVAYVCRQMHVIVFPSADCQVGQGSGDVHSEHVVLVVQFAVDVHLEGNLLQGMSAVVGQQMVQLEPVRLDLSAYSVPVLCLGGNANVSCAAGNFNVGTLAVLVEIYSSRKAHRVQPRQYRAQFPFIAFQAFCYKRLEFFIYL